MNKRDKYFGLSPRIARWKIDTPFENWLSYKADKSEFWKWIYVLYYKLFDWKYYKGGLKYINKYLDLFSTDLKGVSRDVISRDMIYCLHRFGISFGDYWSFGFIDRTLCSRKTFVSDKLRYHYCDILNASNIEVLMTDKYACYQAYKEFYKREVLGCYNETDLSAFIGFVNKHSRFIFKPLTSHSGQGIRIIKSNEINTNDFFVTTIKNGAFIVEELIIQGEELLRVHPTSINSLRVVTFINGDNVHIIHIGWRMGVGGSVVDNAGSGGIYACVDSQSGIVISDARNFKGEHYIFHPDSGVQIIGFQMPKWEEAKTFINNIAKHISGTTLVSWDIAYTSSGWCMVEANDNGAWEMEQSNQKEGLKNVLYSLMDKHFNNNLKK